MENNKKEEKKKFKKLEEIIDDLNVCLDEKYFSHEYINGLKKDGFNLLKELNGYIKYLKHMKETSEL